MGGSFLVRQSFVTQPKPQMCTVDDWIGGESCLRVAQMRVQPEGEHPVFLCNFHGEPFAANDGSHAHG